MVMSNNKMTNLAVFGIAFLALVLSIAGYQSSPDSSIVESEVRVNVSDLDQIRIGIGDLQSEVEGLKVLRGETLLMLDGVEKGSLKIGDVVKLEARLLAAEEAVSALEVVESVLVTEEEVIERSFELVVMDIDSFERNVFSLNEIVYVVGDASGTEAGTVSMGISDAYDRIVLTRAFGIPDEGKFTSIWAIPSNSEVGFYTVVVSDGETSESVVIEVQ